MIRTKFIKALLPTLALGSLVGLASCATGENTASAQSDDASPSRLGQRVDGSLELKDESGRTVSLESLYEQQPIVLTFYRGNWCPYCNRALTEWQTKTADLRDAGGRLVAVSLENLEEVGKTKDKNDLDYTVLSDYRSEVSDYFGLTFQLDEGTQKRYAGFGIDLASSNATNDWELPVTGTYVIDIDGVIRYEYDDPNYQVRADPDEIIAVVRRLN